MNKRHLIAIDLDDTALDNLYELNDITVKVLKELSGLGHKVMIATARPTSMTLPHYQRLELDTPVALCNGADLVNLSEEGSVHFRKYMDIPHLKEIFSILPIDMLDDLGIERNDDLYIFGDMSDSSYHVELIRRSNTQYFDIREIPKIHAGRIFFRMKNSPDATKVIDRLEAMDSIDIYYSRIPRDGNQIYVSIKSILADKWHSIKEVADGYGIPRENIITFGDEYNDKMMLKNAGLGFAMLNGNEDLKQEIGNVTRYSNVDGGVGRELARIFELASLL